MLFVLLAEYVTSCVLRYTADLTLCVSSSGGSMIVSIFFSFTIRNGREKIPSVIFSDYCDFHALSSMISSVNQFSECL